MPSAKSAKCGQSLLEIMNSTNNPYEAPKERGPTPDGRVAKRYLPMFACFSVPFIWICCAVAQRRLLKAGILNTLDAWPFGDEPATIFQLAMNVWWWDAILFLLMVSAPVFVCIGAYLGLRGKRSNVSTIQSVSSRIRQ